MKNVVEQFKNAIQIQDLTFDKPCYVFDAVFEDRYPITEIKESEEDIKIFYSDSDVVDTLNIDDVWTKFSQFDLDKNVVFINRNTDERRKFVSVDECLGDSIDFNVADEFESIFEIPSPMVDKHEIVQNIVRVINESSDEQLAIISKHIVGDTMANMIDCDREAVMDTLEGTLEHSTEKFILHLNTKLVELKII